MGKGQINLNRYQLDRAIKRYHENMCKYMRLREEVDSLTPAASIGQYGVEATLPKAVGANSDPIFQHIFMKKRREEELELVKNELLLVQGLIYKVKDGKEKEVLYWLLEGMSFRWIGAKINMSHTSVQRVRERILDSMLK